MIDSGALGKKVLFLYPPPVLSETVDELARREFEVYLVKDHDKTRRFLSKEPNSIIFLNIDAGMEEEAWERFVRKLMETPETSHVGIGIMSLNDDQNLKAKYLMDLQVACGYITLKIGAAKTVEILSKTLEANEARGRRKFVRAVPAPGQGQFAGDHDGTTIRGEVRDFSTAGMAVTFESDASLKPGTVIRGMTITIKGSRIAASGIIVAHTQRAKVADDAVAASFQSTSVIMFDPSTIDDAKREKLRDLIFKVNQANLDRHFETM